MQRRFWGLLGVLALASCVSLDAPPSKNEVVAESVAATVQVVAERPEGVRRSGSAVLLGRDATSGRALVLTAHHVVAPVVEQTLYVRRTPGSEPIAAELVHMDPEADLAVLATAGVAPAAVRLGSEADLGDRVWVVAYPWGRERTVVSGVVSQIAADRRTAAPDPLAGPVGMIDASVSHGMSGGGVFDASTGRLLGLVRGYRTAQVALPGASQLVRFPVAGETTVIPASKIICFLQARGLDGLEALAAGSGTAC